MRRPCNRRAQEKLAADRAAILALCDGTRSTADIAVLVDRCPGDVWADVQALRRQGHKAPLRQHLARIGDGRAVYRHFGADGRLLYVGCTGNPVQRTALHASQTPWFRQIVRIEIEWFETGAEAIAAELEAIRTENPPFNVAGKTRAA